jgi:signal transduction histidine kinase
LSSAVVYFVAQTLLAVTIILLTRGGLIWLILLPIASQSVVLLPRRWMLALCALFIVFVMVPIGLRSNWRAAAVVSMIFLAALVFVVVFTQIAVSEQKARAEVERLAEELREANNRLREYAVQAEELATVKERNRLAREIHDSLGHYLTVINVQLEAARVVMESDQTTALDALRKAQLLAKEGLADVRRSVAALRTPPIESRPLAESIALLIEENLAAGIHSELLVRGTPRSLAPHAELTLYRAAQEGLTNVRRHAQALRAEVTLDFRDQQTVRLMVQDNGVGGKANVGGFGLLGVRERAQLLGGEFRIRTAESQGFTLEVELPG